MKDKSNLRTQKLTIFLLKDTIPKPEKAIKESSKIKSFSVRGNSFEGKFFLTQDDPHPPSWFEFIRPVFESNTATPHIEVESVSAVLVIKSSGRFFAITFGHGRHLLDPNSYEHSFGLRCVVNRVDSKKLRNIDLKYYDDLVVSTKKQASKSASIGVFELNVDRDLLRGVAGTPRNEKFALFLSGSDALTLHVKMKLENLEQKLEECLKAYKDNAYKKDFEWIDHLNEVRDLNIINTLDELLIEKLRNYEHKNSDDPENPYLAPAEIIDWETVEPKFTYTGGRKKAITFPDINVYNYLVDILGSKGRLELTIERLKHHQVCIFPNGSKKPQPEWSVYSCLIWETELSGNLYILMDQRWFEAKKTFVTQVQDYITSNILILNSLLPEAVYGEEEKDCCITIGSHANYICLDRKLVKPEPSTKPIEICDILSRDKKLIHIKKRSKSVSATLSHLFAQASVSALTLINSEYARDKLRQKHLVKKHGFKNLIPQKGFNPKDYEIVFGIIAKFTKKGPRSLPFFSQVNLMQHIKRLKPYGFKISLQHIDERVV